MPYRCPDLLGAMSVDHWDQVRRTFFAALERPPSERARFVDEACAGDPELRRELDSLLVSHDEAGSFLEMPAYTPTGGARPAEAGSLVPGSRLGPYEIAAAIGSGGMGEVYRATDSRLGREVAIKVLPREMAADPDRRRRFELEARAASALNHPHIVAVYDAGLHDGVPFLVTELLDGQSLTARLAQGPLPVRKALECGVQAARGLAVAHERGIVHRDLKPANMFLTAQGQIKILDFGLAKLAPGGKGLAGASAAATPTTPGLVLGTVGYMSPEQVRGEEVDARSDQFSLGCVLYELLAGAPPFRRPTMAQTMAAVLEAEPAPLTESSQGRTPRPVAWIVERCLAKDPHDRYSSTADLARDLELALSRLSELSLPTAAGSRRRRLPWLRTAAALAATVGLGFAAAWWLRREPAPVSAIRYLTYSGRDSSPAAAPDGSTVAFSSRRDGRRRIWLKQLATGSEAPLTDGDDDDDPRFSPDGSQVIFARATGERVALYRVSVVGGAPRKIVDDALYGDFAPDGRRIAFLRQQADAAGMSSVVGLAAADGSDLRELARLPTGAFVHPRWSPDGRAIAATESPLQLGEPTRIALVDARSGQVRLLPPPGAANVWPGGLAWNGPDALLCSQPESVVGAQTGIGSRIVSLDVRSLRARPILYSPANTLVFDALGPGRLVFEARSLRQNLRSVALPGSAQAGTWLTRGNITDRQPVVSPDGAQVVFSSNRSGNLDLWALSRATGALRRLTDDAAEDWDPAFTRDGRLLWSSNRSGHFEVWLAEADGAGARQLTHDGVDAENPVATPDGRWVLYASGNPAARGLFRIGLDGSGATRLVSGNLVLPEVSPDGRFVAFVADLGSERALVRVLRMPDGGATRFEVPLPAWTAGGTIDQGRCRWTPDGRALAYVGRAEHGACAVLLQEFAAEGPRGRRRLLADLGPDLDAESLAFSPDGTQLIVSFREQLNDLMLAESVPGVGGGRRGR
jgi:serine/threonine protein kinase/Tol biopolymer transport system component